MDPTLDPEVSKLGESKESSQELKVISKYSKNPVAMKSIDLDLEEAELSLCLKKSALNQLISLKNN